MAPDGALRVGGHQVVNQTPVAAGPEQVIPFLKHPCTLSASLAVQSYCQRSAFAFTNDWEMGSGHGGTLQARKGWRAGRKTAVGRPGPGAANSALARPACLLRHPLLPGAQAAAGGLNLEPVPMRLDLGRLPDDGQRHLRCSAGGGDAAVHLSVRVVLAALLHLKIQPPA